MNISVIVALPLYLQYSPPYIPIMQQQITKWIMKPHKRIPKNDNMGSYEIIELNESEPIVFEQTRKKQQELYNQNNRRIMLIIPNSHKYSHDRLK